MKSAMGWLPQELAYMFICLCTMFCAQTDSSVVQLESNNMDDILKSNELVFVNFYADWCRFSQMLGPIFDQTSEKVKADFPEAGKVVLGKVDCDKEGGIAAQYHVSKYPTLKVFRYGTLVKREYRGQRSADALANYVREAVKDPVKRITTMEELENLDRTKRHIIGYFDSETSQDFVTFRKIASMLRDDCEFVAAIGTVSESERATGNRVVYRPPDPDTTDIPYSGDLTAFNLLHTWALDKCVPLVREITFENAEELTEEGLPFLILFHQLDDTETPEKFRKIVSMDLLQEKNGVNFLTADGNKFSHPLYHLGKSTSDLPVLAIDSFRHMYVWKKDPRENLENGEALKQFIADLHSGKLHREFHHGPDKTTEQPKIGADGDDVQAVATADNDDASNAHVQQLVIKAANGMTVHIVRVVEIGNPRQLNLQEGLDQLTADVKDDLKPAGGDGEKPWEENAGKVPGEVASTPTADANMAGTIEVVAGDETKNADLTNKPDVKAGDHKIIHEKVIPVSLTPKVMPVERQDDQGHQPPVRPPMNDNALPRHQGLPLDPHGRPINPQGYPIDPQGRPIDPQGRPIMVDPQGRPIDPRGQPINPHGLPVDLQGRPLDPQGRPIDLQGRPLDPQGRPIDLQGRPLDPQGRPIDPRMMDKLQGGGNGAQRKAPPKSIFRHLGPSKSKYTILRDEF